MFSGRTGDLRHGRADMDGVKYRSNLDRASHPNPGQTGYLFLKKEEKTLLVAKIEDIFCNLVTNI